METVIVWFRHDLRVADNPALDSACRDSDRGVIGVFLATLALTVPWLADAEQEFLPRMDEGNLQISLTADDGLSLDEMDALARILGDLVGRPA